jgi:hypothetical protein
MNCPSSADTPSVAVALRRRLQETTAQSPSRHNRPNPDASAVRTGPTPSVAACVTHVPRISVTYVPGSSPPFGSHIDPLQLDTPATRSLPHQINCEPSRLSVRCRRVQRDIVAISDAVNLGPIDSWRTPPHHRKQTQRHHQSPPNHHLHGSLTRGKQLGASDEMPPLRSLFLKSIRIEIRSYLPPRPFVTFLGPPRNVATDRFQFLK